MKKLISIVIPVYNEEKNIPYLYEETARALEPLLPSYDYEFLFINDGSTDASWREIYDLAQKDNQVKGLNFSRNFGQQTALTAGLKIAAGDFIVTMDCDLQDPPSLIPAMIKKAEQGADIVYARRIKNYTGFFKKITADIYYYLLEKIANIKIPRDVGDFRLLSKRVLKILNNCPERSRYLRGLIAWLGFNYEFVDFERPERQKGFSGYSLKKMLTLAFDGFTGFSTFPLQIAKYLGGISLSLGLAGLLLMIALSFAKWEIYPIWVYLIVILFIFSGFQFIILWIIGEYIGRIYDEEKSRPPYIIKDKLNIKE